MKTAWFHCFAGTAGDMSMGALVDAGADPVAVMEIVGALGLDGYALTFERVMRCGIAATHAVVVVDDRNDHDHEHSHDHDHDDHSHDHDHDDHSNAHGHRPYRIIRELILAAELPQRVRERALATFDALAEIEGAMHRMPPLDVEFHEVGSVDAIVDIVGTCAALEVLGIDRIVCSPIAVSRGTVHAAHGELPTPAPAVAGLLARRNAPAFGIDTRKEIATPTGVALMTTLAEDFGPLPAMRVGAIGYGAGTADIPGRPNVVQVVIGDADAPSAMAAAGQPVRQLEVNVDDVTGEVIAHTIAVLLDAGAHDAWATPIVMKKGRPAHTVHVLCDPALAATIAGVLIAETGSLGVRGTTIERWPQQRREGIVDIDGHPVRVKLAAGRVKVENDDAVAVARSLGWPLRAVLTAAEALGWSLDS
ncbi:MAG: Pyridinium-3,5-bisthiocarboxylic acid mononucleotide nickel insertion protein [Ilumatobacteraceae bacterium]|nr:Pyridinium-3,5-bisthiocarboxylic acid mononucleotide nickel insertion protein [Ilumatobacteraceae bacterium]